VGGRHASGPTYGVCAGDGAFNDCHVIGSTAPDWQCLPGRSTTGALRGHPVRAGFGAPEHLEPDARRPGVLELDGAISGIHHVAIYIGNGNVVQAPQSGDIVRVTPLSQVSWGYFGATRPLT